MVRFFHFDSETNIYHVENIFESLTKEITRKSHNGLIIKFWLFFKRKCFFGTQ